MDYEYDSDVEYFYPFSRCESLEPVRDKTLVSQNNAYQLQLQRYKIFKEQNPETGNFDLTLEFVDGKKLYVHKFLIVSVSETFNAMLSDRWSNNDDRAVKIETYTSDNFFQFLSFLYSGGCDLTDENIFQLTDMAEFYGIQILRDFCDSYLSKMECSLENFFDLLELQERYSLKDLIKSLERFFWWYAKELINVQKFLTLKKCVIKLLSSFKRRCYYEEDFFKAVYKWAENQVFIKHAVCDEQDFNMDDATKNELSEILPLIKFSCMDYEFVKSLIVKKKFLFSLSESIQVLSLSKRMWKAHNNVSYSEEEDFIELVSNTKEEDFIELIYELVEQYALETQKADPEADLKEAIKKKFDEVFPRINFSNIRFEVFTEFLADKEFLFSHTQLCKALSKSIKNKLEEEKVFQKVYEMAEKEAIKKQQLTNDNNDLNDIIKAEMSKFVNDFRSYNMSFGFLIEFIVPKAFIFSGIKLYHGLSSVAGNEDQEILFNTVFKLAEAEATKALSVNPYINVNKYIKRIFLQMLTHKIKFSQIKLEFMIENIVEKRFLFSPSEMYSHLLKCQRSPEQEELFFKTLYSVAEEYVKEKQVTNPAEKFNLKNAVLKELNEYIPKVEFNRMSKMFLTDFVVKNGVLSVNEAKRIFSYRIVAENNGKTLTGAFVDEFGIQKAIEPDGYSLNVRSTVNKQRFTRLKFKIPKTASPLKKMKGVEWYLALEKCGTLVLQSYGNVKASDYLIAEMQTRDDFTLSKGSCTRLKSFV